jgi:hypothetical protein
MTDSPPATPSPVPADHQPEPDETAAPSAPPAAAAPRRALAFRGQVKVSPRRPPIVDAPADPPPPAAKP